MTKKTKCWSADGENFSFDSLGDLLESHPDLIAGSVVHFGEQVEAIPSKFVSASDVIEQIGERAYEFAGEHTEGYPSCTKEHVADLQSLLEGWISKCPKPNFYRVENVQQYTLTDEDTQ